MGIITLLPIQGKLDNPLYKIHFLLFYLFTFLPFYFFTFLPLIKFPAKSTKYSWNISGNNWKNPKNPRKQSQKQEKCTFFEKKSAKVLEVQKKVVPLQPQMRNKPSPLQQNIGIWCNGNTTDSGPVIPGSSPGIPTG